MRITALSAALVALTAFASTASAKNDFSALLADLSFGDAPSAPSVHEPTLMPPASLNVASSEIARELKPAPGGISMPATVSLQDPISLTGPDSGMIDSENELDLNDAFALQESAAGFNGVQAQSVGFGHHMAASAPCNCGASANHGQSCDSANQCVPHVAPNLPSSSLLQYFRSNKCNTNVWDGYQQPCASFHKHTHGQCNCFSKKHNGCGEILAPRVRICDGNNGCDGGCDGGCGCRK